MIDDHLIIGSLDHWYKYKYKYNSAPTQHTRHHTPHTVSYLVLYHSRDIMKETTPLTNNNGDAQDEEAHQSRTFREKLFGCYHEYEILILFAVAIFLAKVYPPLGDEYLYPQITAKWIAVVFIFGTSFVNSVAAYRSLSFHACRHNQQLTFDYRWSIDNNLARCCLLPCSHPLFSFLYCTNVLL